MPNNASLKSFFTENKELVKDYFEVRLNIYRLKLIRGFAKSAGYFMWMLISMFLLFLLMAFIGLVLGFWLTDLTGSYVKGFGLTTLILLIIIALMALLRNVLFVNPIIRGIIERTNEGEKIKDKGN